MDKRLAADGRGLQDPHINDKFAKLAESLYIADRKAREAVEIRANLVRKKAQQDKDKKEQMLSNLAEEARKKRSGLSSGTNCHLKGFFVCVIHCVNIRIFIFCYPILLKAG